MLHGLSSVCIEVEIRNILESLTHQSLDECFNLVCVLVLAAAKLPVHNVSYPQRLSTCNMQSETCMRSISTDQLFV